MPNGPSAPPFWPLLTHCTTLWKRTKKTTLIYSGHHVKLESHGDDVESDDAGDGQVEVLAADDDVDDESRLGVAGPVRQLA